MVAKNIVKVFTNGQRLWLHAYACSQRVRIINAHSHRDRAVIVKNSTNEIPLTKNTNGCTIGYNQKRSYNESIYGNGMLV